MSSGVSQKVFESLAVLFVLALLFSREGSAEIRVTVSGSVQTDGRVCPLAVGIPCDPIPSEPIKGALITIRDSRGRFIAATRSKNDGGFAFKLRRGSYVLSAPRFRHKERIRVGSKALFLMPILVRR